MKRRKLLNAGIAGVISFSGCLTAGNDEKGTNARTITQTPTLTPTTTATPQEEDVSPDDSTPQDKDDPPADCPPTFLDGHTTSCAAESDRYSVRMRRSSSTMEPAEDKLTFELVNGSDGVLSADAKNYRFYQLVDGEWTYILPRDQVLDWEDVDIAPGDRRRWQINLNTADLGSLYPMRKPPRARDYQDFTLRFPPGTYAFGFPVTLAQRDVSRVYARKFDVVGGDLPLEPSAEVAETRDEDSTLVVRTQTSSDDNQRVTLVLHAIENPPKYATTVSLFELYNSHYLRVANLGQRYFDAKLVKPLRDAFAHVDPSIDRIRVETTGTSPRPLGLSYGKSVHVTYEGQGWQLELQEGW